VWGERLHEVVRPFLASIARSIEEIVREVSTRDHRARGAAGRAAALTSHRPCGRPEPRGTPSIEGFAPRGVEWVDYSWPY